VKLWLRLPNPGGKPAARRLALSLAPAYRQGLAVMRPTCQPNYPDLAFIASSKVNSLVVVFQLRMVML
jgi:hypothetical protein